MPQAQPSWPRAVLFDLDGTLIDSLPDIHAALNETLASYGEPPFMPEAVATMVGGGADVLIERAYAALGKSIDPATRAKVVHRYLSIYGPRSVAMTTLNRGASDAVRELRERGVATAVVTNKPEAATADILAHFGLADAMDMVVGGDAGPPLKPAPDLLLLACRKLGVAPSESLFVGDSENDVGAARAAGMPVAVLRGGYTAHGADALGADLVVDRLDEIPAAMAGLAPRAAG